jgi:hypothetical protein
VRYADYAYAHIRDKDDGERAKILDAQALSESFDSTADYIHSVQGRDDTCWFKAANDRICWLNEKENLVGWNNGDQPESSTVIPSPNASEMFERYKRYEAENRDVTAEDVAIRHRGLTEQERQAPERTQATAPQPPVKPDTTNNMTARAEGLSALRRDFDKTAADNRRAEELREAAKTDETKGRSR